MSATRVMAMLMVGAGCSNAELDKCREERFAAIDESHTLQGQVTRLQEEVKRLSETADGLWRTAIRPGDGPDRNTINEEALRRFLDDYPSDPRVKDGRSFLGQLVARREESERASKMESVTIEEIVADPRAYRKALFRRDMYCKPVALSSYTTPSGVAELNWTTGKSYSTQCFWRCGKNQYDSIHCDFDARVEVRLSQSLAQAFARAPKLSEDFSWKYHVQGTLYFAGQIDDHSSLPVMYLKDATFP